MEIKTPTRKPRGFKIALIVLAALLVLFVAVILLLPYLLPINTIKNIAKTQARELAGMDVDFKSLGFGWSGSVVLNDITLAPLKEDGTPGETLLTVDEGRASVSLLPLLSGKIIVNSVTANGFTLRVIREEDGSLNLPDFSKLGGKEQQARASGRNSGQRVPLMAVASETPAAPEEPSFPSEEAPAASASSLPPVEIHRVDLKKGTLGVVDKASGISLDVLLDFLHVEGSDLDSPFLLQGRLLPYPTAPDKGEFPFTGRVALLKGGTFNPEGEANLEIDVKAFSVHELAAQLGLGDLLASGQVDGMIKAAFSGGKGALSIADMRLAKANLGLGENHIINIPDTTAGMKALFSPDTGTLDLTEMSLTNALTEIRGRGWVEGINEIAETGAPVASVEYAGLADFAKATEYLRAQGMGIEGMPVLQGEGSFSGKLTLAKREATTEPLTPAFTLDFNEGSLGAVEENTGIGITVNLKGIGLRAAAKVGDEISLNGGVNLTNVPLRASIPQLGKTPVDASLNGGIALASASEGTTVELRLKDTLAKVPASPYAAAMEVKCPESRIVYDLSKDVASIQAMSFSINESIQGGVSSGVLTGILSGAPQGQADLEFRALLEQIHDVFKPIVPEQVVKLTGSVRSVTRVKMENGLAEALTQGEADQTTAVVTIDPRTSQAQLDTPKVALRLLASLAIDNPLQITVNNLDVTSEGATVRYADKAGRSLAGRLGGAVVKTAGALDVTSMQLNLPALALEVNGMSMALGEGGKQVASVTGGLMKIQGPTAEKPLALPLSGEGDFNVPTLEIGMANLVFSRLDGEQREDSNFGNILATLGVDGYIGPDRQQLVNLRTATLQSSTIAVNSLGQVDLGTGALQARYSTRLAPAGMSAVFAFLGLPPVLLANAEASGALSWNGTQLDSQGSAKGEMRLSNGEVNPFAMKHDLSAAIDTAQESLAISIRSLEGNVVTPSGEAVATLATQPSNLLLSRAGSKGLLDIRIRGSAGPTRELAVGLVGMVPQFRDYSTLLYQTLAQGAYEGWIQVKEQGPGTLGISVGGIWKGAAVTIGNVPYLSEAGQLSAAMEGDISFQDNQIRLSKLFLRSDSALMQADGVAVARLATGQDNAITGLANINVDLRFVMADLAKAAMVFPGLMPAGMGMAGRIDGSFKAGGDASDIRVGEGAVRFQGFRVQVADGVDIAIPSGAANFGATLALHGNPVSGPPSDFEVFRMFNLTGGQASLTGAQFKDKPLEDLSSTFELANGVLALHSAQLRLGGGADASVQTSGTIDFNGAAPAVNLQLAARNIPMSEANSEIGQFVHIESGVVNLPANQGAARVSFVGISEQEILQTLQVDNFNFATGPVVLLTGPALNAELDKARAVLRMEQKDGDSGRRITFTSITGSIQASGNGVILIPHENPVNVMGDNTGDFRAWGEIHSDRSLNVNVAVVGKLENILGFSLPNLIPNLRSGSDEDKNRFMAKMNENAAKEHYSLRVTGNFDAPDISGIGQIAAAFAKDTFLAAPGQILGGVAELGKDAPGAILGAAGAILTAPGQAVKSPGSVPGAVINAPGNTLKGIGRAFGIGGRDSREHEDEDVPYEGDGQAVPQQQGEMPPAVAGQEPHF